MELRYNMTDGSYLEHYGVPGMKWGVRHDKPATGRKALRTNLKNYERQLADDFKGARKEYKGAKKLAKSKSDKQRAKAAYKSDKIRSVKERNALAEREYAKYYKEKAASKIAKTSSAKKAAKIADKYNRKALRKEFDYRAHSKYYEFQEKNKGKAFVHNMLSANGSRGIAAARMNGDTKRGAVAVAATLGGTYQYYYNRKLYVDRKSPKK